MVVGAWLAFGVLAVVDWWAVARGRVDVERWAKPSTLVALIVVTVLLDPVDATVRAWFVAALVLSLAGDVFLLPQINRFVAGLAAFLVGHVAYVGGFLAGGITVVRALGVLPGALLAAWLVGRPIAVGARSHDPKLFGPVVAYMAVISAMVLAAVGSESAVAVVGALLFYVSDACIGWSRFVESFPRQRLAIVTTYHLGQALLVASLAT